MRPLSPDESRAVEQLRQMNYDAREGLPQELFLLVSSLVPLPNADLLVINDKGQLLLSYRDDPYFESAWHIPGGCLRFGEDFAQRIHETALRELGCDVTFESEPIAVRSILRGENLKLTHPNERGHNIAILYRCYLPEGYQINNGSIRPGDNGYLQWFDALPENFMKIQLPYLDILQPWVKREDFDV